MKNNQCECPELAQDLFDDRRNHSPFECPNEATELVERDGETLHLCGNCTLVEDVRIIKPLD